MSSVYVIDMVDAKELREAIEKADNIEDLKRVLHLLLDRLPHRLHPW